MPSDVKNAATVLALSCVATLIAVYFEGLAFDELGFTDLATLGINLIWMLVIAWLIWDLFKRKDIRLSLVVLGVIMLVSLSWKLFEFGLGVAQLFYVLELALFVAAYFLVSTKAGRAWCSAGAS